MAVSLEESFTEFVKGPGSRLRRAFGAAYGPEVGAEATAEALAYAWEHWGRIGKMTNPAGYLFRVGQSRARRFFWRRPPLVPASSSNPVPWVEPGLAGALQGLSEKQRVCVLLVHGFGWTLREVGDWLGVNPSTVQRHLDRGMDELRSALEVAGA